MEGQTVLLSPMQFSPQEIVIPMRQPGFRGYTSRVGAARPGSPYRELELTPVIEEGADPEFTISREASFRSQAGRRSREGSFRKPQTVPALIAPPQPRQIPQTPFVEYVDLDAANERQRRVNWRDQRGSGKLLTAMCVVIGIAALVAAALGIYFGYRASRSVPEPTKVTIWGLAAVRGWQFSNDAHDLNSLRFKQFQRKFCEEVETAVTYTIGRDKLEKCEVLSLSENLRANFSVTILPPEKEDVNVYKLAATTQIYCGLTDPLFNRELSFTKEDVSFSDTVSGMAQPYALCVNNGQCHVNGSLYDCTCNKGYVQSQSGYSCKDINECSVSEAICEHDCENTEGGFICSCTSGYTLQSDGKSCRDDDECYLHNGGCIHHCVNIPGSYKCVCEEGYQLSAARHNCEDVDECSNDDGGCSQVCANTIGSYQCACYPGYALNEEDQHTCDDHDECDLRNGGCHQRCTNSIGFYFCSCEDGYEVGENGYNCQDEDECLTGSAECEHQCQNTQGSFVCNCNPGFEVAPNNTQACTDIVECDFHNAGCEHTCVNTVGSYQCTCNRGFEPGAGHHHCKDIDECKIANGGCVQQCVNTVGGYHCSCESGYIQNNTYPQRCDDVNECAFRNGGCQVNCKNTEGSYYCDCPNGYRLQPDLDTCTDLDECNSGENNCDQVCYNSVGSFHCNCDNGYDLSADGNTCNDIDECKSEANGGCQRDCFNTVGGFTCDCPPGYKLSYDERSCLDADECADEDHGCSHYCENFVGGYRCTCDQGYKTSSDNKTCINTDECVEGEPNGGCEDTCEDTEGNFFCSCPTDGWDLSPNNRTCVDIDECSGTHLCSDYCTNLIGSYVCTCDAGFTVDVDEATCIDLNECEHDNGGCMGSCENSDGTYQCDCPDGYQLADDKHACIEIDECSSSPCTYGHCINGVNSYSCACFNGWTGDSCDTKICAEDWEFYYGTKKCFRLFSNRELFDDAETICNSYGGNLASIHSEEENAFIHNYLQNAWHQTSLEVWIGLRLPDVADPRTRYWTDRSTVDYEHWAVGEPTPGTNGCTRLDRDTWDPTDNRRDLWKDQSCSFNEEYYLCQIVVS